MDADKEMWKVEEARFAMAAEERRQVESARPAATPSTPPHHEHIFVTQ
jgi:hypothetical protein